MQAISEAFLRQSETFADRWPLWTETNILNKELRGLLTHFLGTRL